MKITILFAFAFSSVILAQEGYAPIFTDCTKITACSTGDCASSCSRPQIHVWGFSGPVVKGDTGALVGDVHAIDVASKVTIGITGALPVGVSATLARLDSTGAELHHWGTSTSLDFDTYVTVATTSDAIPGRYLIGLAAISDNATTNRSSILIDIVSASTAISPGGASGNGGSSLAYTVTYAGHGYDGAITPTCFVPGGLSVAVSPSILPPSGGTATATVSIPAGSPGNRDYSLVCNGTGTGVYLVNAAANIHVN